MSVRSRRGGCVLLLVLLVLVMPSIADAIAVTPITESEGHLLLDEAIKFATIAWHDGNENRVGVPYQWGGRLQLSEFIAAVASGEDVAHLGVDASGLIIAAASRLAPDFEFQVLRGDTMARVRNINSALLYQWNVMPIELDALMPGDLIFFSGSSGQIEGVGIYERMAGRHVRFVVASANSGRVVQTSLNLDGEYWATRFAGAGRLLRSEANE